MFEAEIGLISRAVRICQRYIAICGNRVDSKLRECDNYTFLAVLAPNYKFPGWLFPQNAEFWRNSSNPVRIFGPSVCILVPLFYSIRLIWLISADLVL